MVNQLMSIAEFWKQIGSFNQDFAWLHLTWIIISLGLVFWVFRRGCKPAGTSMKIFLSLTFLINGPLFFIVYGGANSARNYVFSALFILVSLLFLLDVFRNKIAFRLPEQPGLRVATILGLLSVYTYPLFGMLLGRGFPNLCMPMDPCPSTVFAIFMVSGAYPSLDRKVLLALLPWGLMGLPKALGAYDCYEDAFLFLAGMYGLIFLIVKWKAIGGARRGARPKVTGTA